MVALHQHFIAENIIINHSTNPLYVDRLTLSPMLSNLAGQTIKAKSVAEHMAFESAKAAIEAVRITAIRLIEDARVNSAIIAAEIAAQVGSALAFKLAAESAVRLAAENKLKLQRQEEEDFIFLVAMAMQSELA